MRALFLGSLMGLSGLTAAKPYAVQSELDKALAPLRTPSGVHLELKRKAINTILEREKSGEGHLYYRKGRLRIEMKSPETSLLVMDGKSLWLESKLDKEMGGKTMVSKTSASSLKKSNTLIAALLENKNILNDFSLKNRKESSEQVLLEFKAREPAKSEVQSLSVWIKNKGTSLSKVQFTDDKENDVTLEFGEPKPLPADSNELFRYVPAKGAEVTEF